MGDFVSDVFGATVTSQDGAVEIDIDPQDLGADGWIVIDRNPEDTTATIPGGYYLLGQTVVGLALYDSSGKIIDGFDSEVFLVLYYSDEDQDGVVDDTDPPIDELTLRR